MYTMGNLVQLTPTGTPTPYTSLSIIPKILQLQPSTPAPQRTAVPVVQASPAVQVTAPLPVPSVTTSTASSAPQSSVLAPAPTPEPGTTPSQGGVPTVAGSSSVSLPVVLGLAGLARALLTMRRRSR